MISKQKNTYTKIIILIFVLSSISLMFFAGLLFYVKKQEKIDYLETKNQFNKDVIAILNMKVLQNESYVNDVVYWDDFVTYLKTRETSWFLESIATSLNTYNFDQLIVLDLEGKTIIKKNKIETQLTDLDVSNSIKFIQLHKTFRFYKKTNSGYVEIIGSGIYNSTNSNKKFGNPNGYFFVVRILNENYFNKLNEITNSKSSISENSSKKNENYLAINLNIFDEKNTNFGNLIFERKYNNHFEILNNIIYFITLLSLLNLLIYFLFIKKWVNNPLNLIRKVLEDNNSKAITNLVNYRGEFGYIGKLLKNNKENEELLLEAKLRAEENDKLKSVFLANLSHEIRTPMNAILGFTNLLKNEKLNKSDKNEFLNTIEISGNNLILIINDLIEMSKIDAKKIEIKHKAVDIDKLVLELYETCKGILPTDKNIKLVVIPSEQKLKNSILTDEIKLKQILTNLITNSVKYTLDGEITIGYKIDQNHQNIEFFVQDTGYGMSKSEQKIIFDRFKRLENDYTVRTSGLGLGLAISKAYVDLMEGKISLISKKNIGTTFYVNLPLVYSNMSPELASENIKTKLKTTITKNLKLLVAEDDNINYLLFQKMLINLPNLSLVRAKDGEEALQIYDSNSDFDIIFLDIKMPKRNGFEVQEKLRELNNTIPVIAQTAFASQDEINEIINAKFDNYILKPLDKSKLIELIYLYSHKNEK